MGWDDAECEDDETFKDILRFIDKYNITKVFLYEPDTPLKKTYKIGFLSKFLERLKHKSFFKFIMLV